jgi:hypothetical protein
MDVGKPDIAPFSSAVLFAGRTTGTPNYLGALAIGKEENESAQDHHSTNDPKDQSTLPCRHFAV